MADRVHARMQTVKAPTSKPPINRIFSQAQIDKLCPRHDPVLPFRQRGDPDIDVLSLS
jgi:hypothetical protein